MKLLIFCFVATLVSIYFTLALFRKCKHKWYYIEVDHGFVETQYYKKCIHCNEMEHV